MTALVVSGARAVDSFLVAPNATAGERAVTYAAAVTGTALALGHAWAAGMTPLPLVVVAVVAFDLCGGATALATRSARLWWHRPGRTRWHHLGFVAAHVQPFALAWLVPGFGWTAAAALYAMVLAGAAVALAVPRALRRPVAFAATAVCLALSAGALPVAPALAWVAPVLLVKLLLAHLHPEEPAATPNPTHQGR